MNEPNLSDLANASTDMVRAQSRTGPASPPDQSAQSRPSESKKNPRAGLIALFALAGMIILGGGWFWWSNRNQDIPTTALRDQPTVVDLQGLDAPQTISGECIQSFTVNGIGTDTAKQQRYALSIQLVTDPADEVALAELMSTDACAGELKLVGETMTERLGLKAAQQELLTTSYKTKSGQRLFLP